MDLEGHAAAAAGGDGVQGQVGATVDLVRREGDVVAGARPLGDHRRCRHITVAAEGDRAVGRHDVRQDQPLGVVQRDVATGGELDVHGVDAGVGSRVARPVLGVDDKSARGPAVEGIGQDQTAMGHLAGRGGHVPAPRGRGAA